jgi:hypothetical protein
LVIVILQASNTAIIAGQRDGVQQLVMTDIEHGRGPDAFEPRVFLEQFDRHASRLVEALGLHFRCVTDAAVVLVGHLASPCWHDQESTGLLKS